MIRAIDIMSNWLGKLAAIFLICLVLLISYNVIMRYAFQASSIGLEELSWHLYAAVFLLGIPFALKTESHVRVDLIFSTLNPRTQALIDLIGACVFLIPTCVVVIWSGWLFTMAAYELGPQPGSLREFFTMLVSEGIGEQSQDPGGLLNRWIIKGVIPLAFFFLLVSAISFIAQRWQTFKHASEKSTNS